MSIRGPSVSHFTLPTAPHLFSLPAELTWASISIIALAIFIGYLSFGATGFGASLVSVPIVAHLMPLTFAVPLISTIDCIAAGNATLRQWRQVDWREFRHLLFPILIGIAIGLTLLINLSRNVALFTLGVFIASYAIYTLTGVRQWKAIRPAWAWPIGIVGGMFSALFGTGGPIYMVFLSSRIDDKSALRATSTVIVVMSVIIRTVAFIGSGLLLQKGLLLMVALLTPMMLAGYVIGSRLHARLSGGAIRRWIAWLLLVNGVLLVARAWGAL